MTARILINPPQHAARNMAIDEALLRLCRQPILRLYAWQEPVVSIGYFQAAAVVESARSFIRRYTGGGLVDHAHDITYSIILPTHHPIYVMGTAGSYRVIHEGIAQAFEALGCASTLAAVSQEETHPACFQRPMRFDLVDPAGRKLAGAAQRRTRAGCLHQGSILPPSKNLDRSLWQSALRNHLLPLLAETIDAATELTAEEFKLAVELEETRYGTHEWNYQR